MTVAERVAVPRRARDIWKVAYRLGLFEALVVVAAFLVYFVTRGLVIDRADDAFANANDIIAFQRALGLYHERSMQEWILDSRPAIKVMNFVYFWGHMPVIILFALWLWFWNRGTYSLMRNAFLASGAIGVVIYALYPVAPPRLLPLEGFVDTMALYDRAGYNAQETAAFVNPYAAVPSLHFGWALLLGGAVAVVSRVMILRVVGVLWPVAMFFSIILTGNHFIFDAVAGALVSLAGLGVAFTLRAIWPQTGSWLGARRDG